MDLKALQDEILACNVCTGLPLGPRPVFQFHEKSRILIAGQAPGKKVHESGIPFDDASGKRLREWLGLSPQKFYDPRILAIVPMGFCYPGTGTSGDLPPRSECAQTWHQKILKGLKNIELTICIGSYAQDYYLGSRRKNNLTETIRAWKDYAPELIALPHPSPRNNIWLKQNPWFEDQVLPELKKRVARTIS